jgi:hypothetical protein
MSCVSIFFGVRQASPSACRAVCLLVGLLSLQLGSSCSAVDNPPAEGRPGGAAGVRLTKTDRGWALQRNGSPYLIRGVGGDGSKEMLAKLGGNSFRTWSTDNLQQKLDEAERLGLSVSVGIWLGHERHGFDYNDADQVAKQYEAVRDAVRQFKDHPAVLIWALGNEMEGPGAGDNAAIWSAINKLATLVKRIDPNHPTMTVIAEIGGDRVRNVHRLCPDIDIIGINSYAGADSLADRYRAGGGTKPYVLTEFGPPGPWEVGKSAWGAPFEPTSSEKALVYRRSYEKAVRDADGLCLGSYAFVWGQKQETTATWFGMLLPDGSRLGAVDKITELWTGTPPRNRCPIIRNLAVDGQCRVAPNGVVRAVLTASDPEGDDLNVEWLLQADPLSYGVGGDAESVPPEFPDAIVQTGAKQAEVRLPAAGGGYRLFAFVRDRQGGAATANVPLFVEGGPGLSKAQQAELPLVIYDEAGRSPLPYIPSGWMGNVAALRLDDRCESNPHSGKTCVRIDYTAPDQWAGIAWQHPENDFGDKPGGWDVTGAKRLALWLRGDRGNERVTIELGIVGADKKFPDTTKAKLANASLSIDWQEYTLELKGDLTRIKTGLVLVVTGAGQPIRFFMDDCRYE